MVYAYKRSQGDIYLGSSFILYLIVFLGHDCHKITSENNVQYTVYDVTLISLDSCGSILDFVTSISELVAMTICLIVRVLREN